MPTKPKRKSDVTLRKTGPTLVAKVTAMRNGGIRIDIPPTKAAHLMQRLEKQHGKRVQR